MKYVDNEVELERWNIESDTWVGERVQWVEESSSPQNDGCAKMSTDVLSYYYWA